jgi:NADH-quinone oxidoreductase subunit J
MIVLFILASLVALVSTIFVVTRRNAIHALLYLIVSFLAVALIFYLLGAPFVAALEVIIYAGAIMVLFVFAVMVLNPGSQTIGEMSRWTKPSLWLGPAALTGILGVELLYTLLRTSGKPLNISSLNPQQVGMALYGPYILGVEMVSMLLLAGLVSAYHLGRQRAGNKLEGDNA